MRNLKRNTNHENCVEWCKLHLESDKSAEWKGARVEKVGKTLKTLLYQLENTNSQRIYNATFQVIRKIKKNIC